MKYDYVIVGCGITGAAIARKLAETNKRVLILERRNHIGGNMYDYVDEHGVLVHQYGPHAFHTTKKELFDFLNQFEEFEPYVLRCGAILDGKHSPTPFNFKTIDDHYSKEEAETLKQTLKDTYGERESVTIVELLSNDNPLIKEYAEFLFENDYRPYTSKQWGMKPEEVDVSVLKRVPVRLSYIDAYYDDEYQYMPKHSYSTLFENMLNHPNITIQLNEDALQHLTFKENKVLFDDEEAPVIYTGPIDELFKQEYGELPYRSLRFELKHLEDSSFQEAPVVAYPFAKDYTRVTEYKKLPNQNVKGTTIAYEYPLHYEKGKKMEPYYPLLKKESMETYAKYEQLAKDYTNLICCGRLGSFKYYNMDNALEEALSIVKQLID